ncbi:CsbD family protein [Streptomyces sp. NPDC051567]|uniref:CsbD family protein n=1 Tax=Streptomyces sp. NPDC051567 TaxID=3365660 RepID=UPI0037B80428
MSKAKAKAKQVKGGLKETVGRATDDRRMRAEGGAERMSGKAQELAAKAGDRLKKAKDAL